MNYVPLGPLLTVLGAMLALSILVERLLTIANWVMERLLVARYSLTPVDDKKHVLALETAERACDEEERLRARPPQDVSTAEIEPHPVRAKPDSRFDVRPVTEPDSIGVYKEFYFQLIGFAVATLGCKLMNVSAISFLYAFGPSTVVIKPWEYILTGIIIGAGSKPVHFLIDFLVTRKIEVSRSDIEEAQVSESRGTSTSVDEAATVAPVVTVGARPSSAVKTIEEIVGFTYDGGDRPERLEQTHLRGKTKVDLIVYHHTTMHSSASFNELVKVFDQKGWLTGYHCVVFADGSIRVLCRWDRMGNHAIGCNARAMGLAFQGNFESDPRVRSSNLNGVLGILRPTEAQVDSAARVTALWSHLFKVPLKFQKKLTEPRVPDNKVGIVPHRFIANKACPGGNFPYDEYESRVAVYHNLWAKDELFNVALQQFRMRPLVLVPSQSLVQKASLV